MSFDVLLIGSGAREHALAWKISQSQLVRRFTVAPGNPGTAAIAENVPLAATDIPSLVSFAKERAVGLTIVGPDDPLALGVVDSFKAAGLPVFGPTKAAARIESSKAFAKQLMREIGIPTAAFRTFTKYDDAFSYLYERDMPIVVKASGLALGKGVYVCKTHAEAEGALRAVMLEGKHGEAGQEVVIEEYLDGPEISAHAICDGKEFLLFPPAQDHKRVGEGDTGGNTGGMGTLAPVPFVSGAAMESVAERVIRPALHALAAQGAPFSGLLFPGLKMTPSGPKVLEFNARFGDPETQVYMRLMKSDIVEYLKAVADGAALPAAIEWNGGFAANIVLTSRGYPDLYQKGFPITGIEEAQKLPGVVVFHGGTALEDGLLRTAGGRVISVSAVGPTLRATLERAYEAAALINFEGKYFRGDIGAKALTM